MADGIVPILLLVMTFTLILLFHDGLVTADAVPATTVPLEGTVSVFSVSIHCTVPPLN